MNCVNCGNVISPKDVFCASCGQAVQNAETGAVENNIKPDKIISVKKKLLKTLVPVVSAFFIVIITAITIISNVTTKISLKDYIYDEIVFEGINGYGSIKAANIIDLEGLTFALIGDMERAEAIWEETDLDPSVFLATNYIEFELSENNGTLSNGDIITLTAHIDKNSIKDNIFYTKSLMGKKIQTFEFEVAGLEDGVALDIFDAIEGCYYDTTKEDVTGYYTEYKYNYSKDYDNGITVVTENNSIVVYGDDFQSFEVQISQKSDKVSAEAKTTKLIINNDPNYYIDLGIVFKETEKEIKIDKLSYVKSNIFNKSDLKILQDRAVSFASEKFDINNYPLTNAALYTGNLRSQALVYFFKGKDGLYIVFFEHLLCDSQNNIYNVESVEPQTSTTWFSGARKYDSMEALYEHLSVIADDPKIEITIIK